jgi:hypothetical protein
MSSTANSKETAKKKPRGKPFPKGVSGNPAGAPKRGESWAEIIKRIGDMTPAEATAHAQAIAGKLKVMGDGITLREAVVIRVYADLLFQPTASLFNSFMDRTEGKVKEQVDVTSNGQSLSDNERVGRLAEILDALRARRDRQAPDDGTQALPATPEETVLPS